MSKTYTTPFEVPRAMYLALCPGTSPMLAGLPGTRTGDAVSEGVDEALELPHIVRRGSSEDVICAKVEMSRVLAVINPTFEDSKIRSEACHESMQAWEVGCSPSSACAGTSPTPPKRDGVRDMDRGLESTCS
jgi:hypothetical protein